jgi:hypothetical protein
MVRFRFHMRCKCCGAAFRANTRKGLRSAENRHTRESHGTCAALEKRRIQQAGRLAAIRKMVQVVTDVQSRSIVFVTCPRYRETMWTSARAELLRIGFGAECIRRRFGILWSEHEKLQKNPCARGVLDQRLPPELTRSTFLHYDFHKSFLPKLLKAFDTDKSLKWGTWVEDDIAFKAGFTAKQLGEVAIRSSPSAVWAGYYNTKGVPTWGSHCLVMTKVAAVRLLAELDQLAEAAVDRTGRPFSYLRGLDTWFKACVPKIVQGHALMVVPPSTMAYQRSHKFKGRQ